MKNPNCDGGFCVLDEGEVKKYPIGDDQHMILCVYCWGHENQFREEMVKEWGNDSNWPRPSWFHTKVYDQPREELTKTDIIKKFAAEHGMTVVEAPLGHLDQPGGQPVGFNEMPTLDEIIADINKVLGNKPKK